MAAQHLGLGAQSLGGVAAAESLVLRGRGRALPYLVLDDRPYVSVGELTTLRLCRSHTDRRSRDVFVPRGAVHP